MMIRFRRYTFRCGPTWWKPQWRKRRRDPWRDVFISPFRTEELPDAILWARREFGPDAAIEAPRSTNLFNDPTEEN
ncbi:MAG: hypothetical protein MEQ84_11780 [Mesorhizobium sp.]|nr:hypothetical protein [Mesorhizobium sp.]